MAFQSMLNYMIQLRFQEKFTVKKKVCLFSISGRVPQSVQGQAKPRVSNNFQMIVR